MVILEKEGGSDAAEGSSLPPFRMEKQTKHSSVAIKYHYSKGVEGCSKPS